MSDLLELAARCEVAAGADRELDALIARATAWRWDGWEEGNRKIEEMDVEALHERVRNSWTSIWRHLPEYTASIDAALKLVPEGCWAEGSLSSPSMMEVNAGGVFEAVGVSTGRTPALALTAAALRARTSLPTAAPAGSSSSPASLHSLGTGAAEATGGGE